MNKLITTYNGGMPFTLDDLTFLQNNIEKGFVDIIRSMNELNANNIILNGINYNLATEKVSAGTFFHDDRIYYLPEDVTVDSEYPEGYELYYTPSYDQNGIKVFNNGIAYSVYLLDIINLARTEDIPELPTGSWRIPLEDTKKNGYSTWKTLVLSASPLMNWVDLSIRLMPNGFVGIRGKGYLSRIIGSDPNLITLGILDKIYRPSFLVDIAKGNNNGSISTNGTVGNFTINEEGTVALRVPENVAFGSFYLNDIYPL